MSTVVQDTFSSLTPYQPRTFVPLDANLTDKDTLVSLYKALVNRPINSKSDLEQFMLDRSELDAAASQAGSILYIRMTCQTDDKAKAKAYMDFTQDVAPAIQPFDDDLNKKFLKAYQQYPLDEKRYEVYVRSVKSSIDLYVEKNIAISTKISLLSQEYQQICGAMMVTFDGREQTLPQMSTYLQQTDRALREKAWWAIGERRQKDRKKLDELFNKMLKLRHQKALNAGCKDFCDYQFKAYERFDYTRDDCKTYHQVVEDFLVPLGKEITQRRAALMELDQLRPWDLSVDAQGLPPLKPFNEVEELIDGVGKMFNRTDAELGQQFQMMRDKGLLDLASRKGKAPGGYQNTLSESRVPFIFMNAVGVDQDVSTLLHEGGHAFHALACAQEPLSDYRHAPMEYCEVASMAMELLAGEHLDIFYNEDDKKRAQRENLEDIIKTLIWVANIDAFQHWIYENPNHTTDERTIAWLDCFHRFGGNDIEWKGLEDFRASTWHRQLHIFEVPFYYIEYAIAQLGALQIWSKAKKDPVAALAGYKNGLALGGSRPLPELYQATGIKFDFSAEMIKPLVEEVQREWKKLS